MALTNDDMVEDYPGRLLQQAAIYNNTDFLESLLQGPEKEYVNIQDPFGRTALYTSVTNNSLECGHMLLQAGADPNISCGPQCGSMTPLHAAALDNKHKFVTMLLEFGADVNREDSSGEKALDLAEKNRSDDCFALLSSEMESKRKEKEDLENEFLDLCRSGQIEKAKSFLHILTEDNITNLINTCSDGQSSLLYQFSEQGNSAMVEFLLSQNVNAHVHLVTGFSPLHAACQANSVECVQLLLQCFPELVRHPTIDGMLPLHMICADGNLDITKALLHFSYPDRLKKLDKELKGDRMYRLGLAINPRDGHGRTPLHLSVENNHIALVQQLLEFRVPVALKYVDGIFEEVTKKPRCEESESDNGKNVNQDSGPSKVDMSSNEEFCPVVVDLIDLEGNTPLHLSIKQNVSSSALAIAGMLLQSGANPNKPIISPSGNSTPLMEACQREDVDMMELLLNFGAKDEEQVVIRTALRSSNWDMIGVMLQYRSHLDSEYKINGFALREHYIGDDRMEHSTMGTLRGLWPSKSVVINWHGIGVRGQIQRDWLLKACWQMVGQPPRDISANLTLFSVTRIDVSSNRLESLPEELFQMQSLRVLNAANNHLVLIVRGSARCHYCGVHPCYSSVSDHEDLKRQSEDCMFEDAPDKVWNCPVLEEINLQRNKLRLLPTALFKLPALKRLNIAENELETVPFSLWRSPVLFDLNLSSNKLTSLPHNSMIVSSSDITDSVSLSSISLESPVRSIPSTPRKDVLRSESPAGTDEFHFNSPSLSPTPLQPVNNTPSQNDHGGMPAPSSPETRYYELPVVQFGHWKSRVRVKHKLEQNESSADGDETSKLGELNLSHNSFENVPLGLACLAPHLSKLNLAHNRLSHVGSVENLPANLKWMDLSFNNLKNAGIYDNLCAAQETDGSLGLSLSGIWALRPCYDPVIQAKQIKRLNKPRSGSSASIQSSGVAPGGSQVYCPHRLHRQLDRLKTLRLAHNRLSRLPLWVETDDDLNSSGSESQKSQSSTSSAGKRDGIRGGAMPELGGELSREQLFPSLTTLDVSHNSLTALQSEISEMQQLSELKINSNRLKELPPELGLLKKLWNLDYSGCPVEKTLHALLGDKSRKATSVLSYLKSVKEEATLYNRMKLMFVGVQGIGKTSLLSQLRKEGKSSHKYTKNWAQRMGHSSGKDKDLKGENISTVGVDIGDLILQRGNKDVIFSTWDFGGQKEYYATHQYFLSKRSLYLVVWKVTDGEQGVNNILQWLINIQARAPNSPVILVGTHLDLITKKHHPPNYVSDLQRMVFERYMCHTEPEKSGLPRVVGRIEVSCRSRMMLFNNHISDLTNLIWSVVFEEQLPGAKGARLLEQKVPSSYVHLQDVVGLVAQERKLDGKDPVLHAEQYKPLIIHKMEELYNTSFRDVAELNQATQFLHENGVLLHYDDPNLQDIYFLDPQWLCDILASVVTIREINSLAKAGIMRTEDLKILFKNAAFKPDDIKTYIISLLSKFEVALMWDAHHLLIPSLLPSQQLMDCGFPGADIRIPARGFRGPTSGVKKAAFLHSRVSLSSQPSADASHVGRSVFYIRPKSPEKEEDVIHQFSSHEGGDSFHESSLDMSGSFNTDLNNKVPERVPHEVPVIAGQVNPAVSIVRLYLMAYFPSGFWPRLITRLLGDESLSTCVLQLYDLCKVKVDVSEIQQMGSEFTPQWRCWQSGLELQYLGVTVLRLREVPKEGRNYFCDYRQCNLVIKLENDTEWSPLDVLNTSILEMIIPNETLHFQFDVSYPEASLSDSTVIVQPNPQIAASLLAKIVEHVDTLLEDWYPDIGVRFVQNARGMYLITRIVPCSRCLLHQVELQRKRLNDGDAWSVVEVNIDHNATLTQPILIGQQSGTKTGTLVGSCVLTDNPRTVDTSLHAESAPVGGGWMGSLRDGGKRVAENMETLYSITAHASKHIPNQLDRLLSGFKSPSLKEDNMQSVTLHCHLVEQCLQAAQMNKIVYCPLHGNLGPYFIASDTGHTLQAHVAPDSVFQDVGDEYLVDQDLITRGRFLGKGSFGAVFAGSMIHKYNGSRIPIAIKMMQPVQSHSSATPSQQHHMRLERQRWTEDPMKKSCEAYLNARKELSILLSLKHPHIVPLLGISLHPLCLLLSLAPQGSLSEQLQNYHRAGAKLPVWAIWKVIVQVMKALDYLHRHQIIYRDLKSENVLVWCLPEPHHTQPYEVHIKLADYGVSRSVLPSGAKGFAGTPPFIAPEIIQHNGEESYTEKVDIFSFGMFVYELLVLRLPFDGEDSAIAGGANLKSHVLAGGRPPLTHKELLYPVHILDLMTLCWAHDPGERPSASEILSLVQQPAFCHLTSVTPLEEGVEVMDACATHQRPLNNMMESQDDYISLEEESVASCDVWLATRSLENMEGALTTLTYQGQDCIQIKKLPLGPTTVSCLCEAGQFIWAADTAAVIHIFSLASHIEVLKFPATTRPNINIRCLAYGEPEHQIYVVLANGRMIVCDTELPEDFSHNYSPVKTECPGNGKPIHAMATMITPNRSSELWCGQSEGRISVWNLHSTEGSLHRLTHPDIQLAGHDVVFVKLGRNDHSGVWTYVYPGSVVFRWDAIKKVPAGQLDVATVIPPDDSKDVRRFIQGKGLTAGKSQVSVLAVLHTELYIGTTLGCIIVADKDTMSPIKILHCHSDQTPYIKALIPLVGNCASASNKDLFGSVSKDMMMGSLSGTLPDSQEDQYIVSVGKGYRDLISSHLPTCKLSDIPKATMYALCWSANTFKITENIDQP